MSGLGRLQAAGFRVQGSGVGSWSTICVVCRYSRAGWFLVNRFGFSDIGVAGGVNHEEHEGHEEWYGDVCHVSLCRIVGTLLVNKEAVLPVSGVVGRGWG